VPQPAVQDQAHRFAPAEGAFYLYVDVLPLTRDSVEFCRRMLDETGVATTPGRDFDPIQGDNWVRLSFAGSAEDIAEALPPPLRLTATADRQPETTALTSRWPWGTVEAKGKRSMRTDECFVSSLP
jgi:hypothetical protein